MPASPYDEMTAPDGTVRPHYRAVADWLTRTPPARVAQKREEAERAFHRLGITFAVAGEDTGTERLIPFDLIPRIIAADEWSVLERGLLQRVRALNAFLDFRRDAAYVYALGPDNGVSAAALADVVAGKEGIDPDLAAIVAAAIARRDRPAR